VIRLECEKPEEETQWKNKTIHERWIHDIHKIKIAFKKNYVFITASHIAWIRSRHSKK